jgi:glycosyltransferase involved in cell wall biosynthesis
MKLIYLTAKKYPASTADHIFVREMSKAFSKILGGDFMLVLAGGTAEELSGINKMDLGLEIQRGLSLYYFLWLPFFIRKKELNDPKTVFFSNDANLLAILIFWKKALGFRCRIASDWHMLFEDWHDAYVAKNSDALVCTTGHLKDLISKRIDGIDPASILVAHGGVDPDIFKATDGHRTALKKRLGLPEGAFLVGYVGFYRTMGMSKGLATMINALSLMKKDDIKMVFVGGKPEEIEEYLLLAKEKGVSESCIFIPVVASPEVISYEQAMDVLIIPYPDRPHFREYGFPMKAYEYMASGNPIIYSDLPIIAEVLGDCATAFKADSSKDLAEKIIQAKNDFAHGEDLARKARAKAGDCTWEKRAEKIIDFVSLKYPAAIR